jgi:RimJ/RimL family protein N-acetyltransferase
MRRPASSAAGLDAHVPAPVRTYDLDVPPTAFPVRTARLLLRPFTAGDIDDLFAYLRDPDVVRYLPWEVGDREAARAAIERRLGQTWLGDHSDHMVLAVEWPEAGHVVGEMMLRITSREHQQGEVGFVFAREFHGKGLGTEALEPVLALAFETFGLHRVFGRCDVRNPASAALMNKVGMRREAHFLENELFKGEWSDEYVYAMRASDWRAQRA